MRKEGPLDFTRYVECEFASPFRGEDYVNAFQGVTPDEQDSFDIATIDVGDHVTNGYTRIFRGIVTGVGNTGENTRMWSFRAQGPGHLLSNIPASKTFRGASSQDILNYVASELNEKVPFDVAADIEAIETPLSQQGTTTDLLRYEIPPLTNWLSKNTDLLSTPKTFQANKHTLADVVNWIKEKTDIYVWLTPTENGVALTSVEEAQYNHHRAHYLNGELYIENNDALSELRPVNTQVVKGAAKQSRFEVGDFEVNSPSDTYVEAKARHTELYQRAGEVELHGETTVASDAESKREVSNEVRRILKEQIEGTTAGDMQCLLRGPITPFDTVEALPVCNGKPSNTDQSLTYEVSRVHHKIRGTGIPKTELNVGLHVDDRDIEVVNSWEKPA